MTFRMKSAACALALAGLPLPLPLPPILSLPAPARAAPPAADAASTRSLYLQLIGQARIDGKPRAALAYLDDFERQYPGDTEALLLRINSLLDLGEVGKAEAAAAALPSGGGVRGVNAVRGHLLAARGRWADALPFYQAALRDSPADPMTRNALGYAQLRAGQTRQAIETLRGAVDLAPAQEVVRNNLLLALTVGGYRSEASVLLQAVRNPQARGQLSRQIAAEAARIQSLPDHQSATTGA